MAYSKIEQAYIDGVVDYQFPDPIIEEPQQPMMLADSGQVKSDAQGGFGTIGPIPRNRAQEAFGYVGELLTKAGVQLDKVGLDIPILGRITLKDLTVGESGKVLEDMSYGFMPVEGGGNMISGTKRIKPDAALELLNLAPAVGAAAKVAGKGAKALAPKAAEMAEDYMVKQGLIKNVVPESPKLSAVKPGDELIVQHNLTAENLMNADKLGGLPVPSLAISKAAMPLENFGEITLIAPKEMATPSANNPVFAADAYTKRFPTIDYSFDRKSVNSLKTVFGDVIDKTPEGNSAFDRLIDDWSNREYSDLMKAKYVSETGKLPQTANRSDFSQQINKIVYDNPTAYRDWLANFDEALPGQGVEIKERLFKGFTYSGNRMYRQATLENIVKEMKGGAGKENWDYGAASLRAKVTPKFRTFAQIKAGRDRIIDPADFEKIKSEANDKYSDLIGRLAEMNVRYDGADAIAEVAETRNLNALNRIYPDIPQELKADIASFLNTLKSMPTEYFEIKPQRAVGINEFTGAIIPKDTPQKAREVLKKNGITEIYEYSTPEERKSLFQKYGKEMFTVAPAIPAAATQEEKK